MNKQLFSRAWLLPIVGAFLAVSLASQAFALTTITSQLDFGASGGNVTSLQQFLATDASIYPEGLVTGYFGSLTRAAVQRFQCREAIVCAGGLGYGRVGPRTLTVINAMIGGNAEVDASAPIMGKPVVSTTTASATVTWTTNEPARGTLYYSTSPLLLLEGSATANAVIGGQTTSETTFGLNHALNVSGVQPNTWYHYAATSVDASGNLMLSWPNTFRTAP